MGFLGFVFFPECRQFKVDLDSTARCVWILYLLESLLTSTQTDAGLSLLWGG